MPSIDANCQGDKTSSCCQSVCHGEVSCSVCSPAPLSKLYSSPNTRNGGILIVQNPCFLVPFSGRGFLGPKKKKKRNRFQLSCLPRFPRCHPYDYEMRNFQHQTSTPSPRIMNQTDAKTFTPIINPKGHCGPDYRRVERISKPQKPSRLRKASRNWR